jgi:hypothetical protein
MGEWRYRSIILNLSTRWRWVISYTSWPHFTPRKIFHSIHWIGGWVAPRASLDIVEKRKIFPGQKSNPGCPAYSYTDWAITTPLTICGKDIYNGTSHRNCSNHFIVSNCSNITDLLICTTVLELTKSLSKNMYFKYSIQNFSTFKNTFLMLYLASQTTI